MFLILISTQLYFRFGAINSKERKRVREKKEREIKKPI